MRFFLPTRPAVLRMVASGVLLGALAQPTLGLAQVVDTNAAVDAAIDPAAIDSAVLTPTDPGVMPDAAAPSDSANPAFAPLPLVRPVVADKQYGMNMFIWNHPDTTGRDLGVLHQAGFGWQKTLLQWRQVEGAGKGVFDWKEADRVVKATSDAGVKLLVRVDFQPTWARSDNASNGRPDNLQDYADFVRAVADRYKPGSALGHVDAIEIWNEPNLQREWGEPVNEASASNYVQMLKLSYSGIKSVSPTTLVVTAGLSPTGWSDDTARPDDKFLGWLFDAGMSGNYDVLGLHGNSQASDPTAAPGSLPGMTDGSFYFRRVEQLRAVQEARGDANKPVWLLEFGWTADAVHPAYSWFAVSEEQKASNVMSAFNYARANWPWLGTMFVWTLPDPSWGQDREEFWWAIAEPNGTARPTLTRILEAARTGTLPS